MSLTGEKQIPVWLVWAVCLYPKAQYPVPDLRAVDTSEAEAKMHSQMLRRDEPHLLRVNIEKRIANHLYAHSLKVVDYLTERLKEQWK